MAAPAFIIDPLAQPVTRVGSVLTEADIQASDVEATSEMQETDDPEILEIIERIKPSSETPCAGTRTAHRKPKG